MVYSTSALGRTSTSGSSGQNRAQSLNIAGYLDEPVTLSSLPARNTKRWVIRRKAAVVIAVREGLLSLTEACERYALSVEEFLSWQQAIEHHGVAGLRTTRLQEYREEESWSSKN